jgi:hypothetical protein
MKDEIPAWRIIKNILDAHPKRTFDDGVDINFKDKAKCDYKETISKWGTVIKYDDI